MMATVEKRKGNHLFAFSKKRPKFSSGLALAHEHNVASVSFEEQGTSGAITKSFAPCRFLPDSRTAARHLSASFPQTGSMVLCEHRLKDEVTMMTRRSMEIRANAGDAEALFQIGCWYEEGQMGFPRDPKLAYQFYQNAANKGDIRGMASAGLALIQGHGVENGANVVEGMALLDRAAHLGGGSDLVAFWFGLWYSEGKYGLPRNSRWAIFWLRKVVNGNCGVQQLNEDVVSDARVRLSQLSTC